MRPQHEHPKPGDREPRKLYFLVRYDWETRALRFCRYNSQEAAGMYENLGPDESVHRCQVDLTPNLGSEAVMPELLCDEMYNETDQIHPDVVTPWQIMRRINMCRVVPILPLKGYALGHYSICRQGPKVQEEFAIQNEHDRKPLRRFRITVEELPTHEKIMRDLERLKPSEEADETKSAT